MPMGIVSDKDFEKEVKDSQVITPQVLPMIKPGRNEGDNNVPDGLRKIIGETSEIEGRQEALSLARQFGISDSSVSAYSNGSTSTSSMDKQPNLNHINEAKARISKKAQVRLIRALNHITEDKLERADVGEIASVARAMSGIVKEMEPETPKEDNSKTGPTFIFYSPQVKTEQHYDIVNARE